MNDFTEKMAAISSHYKTKEQNKIKELEKVINKKVATVKTLMPKIKKEFYEPILNSGIFELSDLSGYIEINEFIHLYKDFKELTFQSKNRNFCQFDYNIRKDVNLYKESFYLWCVDYKKVSDIPGRDFKKTHYGIDFNKPIKLTNTTTIQATQSSDDDFLPTMDIKIDFIINELDKFIAEIQKAVDNIEQLQENLLKQIMKELD